MSKPRAAPERDAPGQELLDGIEIDPCQAAVDFCDLTDGWILAKERFGRHLMSHSGLVKLDVDRMLAMTPGPEPAVKKD